MSYCYYLCENVYLWRFSCECFQDGSPFAAQVGLYLIESGQSDFITHFGLQLMEHCIKYRWNQLSQPEKLFIKVLISEKLIVLINTQVPNGLDNNLKMSWACLVEFTN